MREIKFRQIVKRGKSFSVHYWGFIGEHFISPLYSVEPPDVKSDQYTGLKDKNGKEIYEGAIINWFEDIGKIVWHKKGYWSVKWNKKNTAYNNRMAVFCGDVLGNTDDVFSKFEVIGNIYENPELLKEVRT